MASRCDHAAKNGEKLIMSKKPKIKKPAPKGDNVLTLRDLCTQLKIDPVAARWISGPGRG
jgi:hypothetical protein